jgi:hypothetical protein
MSNDDPIRDALRRHADEIGASEHPLGLDDVKGRARGIRRRRIAVSGLAAAAVLAVVVPAGMALDDRVTGTRDPDVAASRTPSPTSLASPTPGSQPGLLTTHVDGHSGEPGIPVVYDGKIQVPGGSPVPVKGDYDQVAALGDGWVGVGRDDQRHRKPPEHRVARGVVGRHRPGLRHAGRCGDRAGGR